MKTVKKKAISEKEYLDNLLDQFTKIQIDTKGKIERYEDIMNRKSSKKWDASKKQKMTNRLAQARLEYSQTFEIIDQIKNKLTQISV
jgi:hypothetical protein